MWECCREIYPTRNFKYTCVIRYFWLKHVTHEYFVLNNPYMRCAYGFMKNELHLYEVLVILSHLTLIILYNGLLFTPFGNKMFQTLLKDIGLFKKRRNSQIALTHTSGVLYNVKLFILLHIFHLTKAILVLLFRR